MAGMPRDDELEALLAGYKARDRRAFSRLLTRVENGRDVERILAATGSSAGGAFVVGVTGAPGAGKSTLVGALLKHLRRLGRTVCVLACDPASPYSGGALLGDRVRMDYDAADAGAFVRSFSSRGAEGALGASARPLIRLAAGFGFDVVLVETVGAGQDELAVRDVVDVLLLVLTPLSGDEVQWEKAGLMEAADLLVLNKADLVGSDDALAGLKAMLGLDPNGPEAKKPIIRVVASKEEGLAELWEAIETLRAASAKRRKFAAERFLVAALRRRLDASLAEARTLPDLEDVFKRHAAGELSDDEAAALLWPRLARADRRP